MAQQLRRAAGGRRLLRQAVAAALFLVCLLLSAAYARRSRHSSSTLPVPDTSSGVTSRRPGRQQWSIPSAEKVSLEHRGGSGSASAIQDSSGLHPYGDGENRAQQVDLFECLAEPPGSNETWMTADMYLQHAPNRLTLDLLLLSPYKSAVDVSLVVTYDVSRLYMLDGLCLSWGGPISAAVYQVVSDDPPSLTKDEPIRDARYRINDIFERVRQQRTCSLDIMLFTEQVPRADPTMAALFPVNALRNRALLLARTSMVLVIDGDLLLQAGLRRKLQPGSPGWQRLLAEAQAGAFHVLPSFDTRSTTTAYRIAAGDKEQAVAAYRAKDIVRFGAKNSRFPQGCTDYDRWPNEAEQYEVIYCNRYEPWGLVSRLLTPWFDSRFRGYGRNKIMYAAALNSSGFSFQIDPEAFIIHRPHTKSTAQRIFDDENDRRIHNHIMAMFDAQRSEGFFDPVVDATAAACRERLPWWRPQDLADAELAAPRLRRADQRRAKTAAEAAAQAAAADVQDVAAAADGVPGSSLVRAETDNERVLDA